LLLQVFVEGGKEFQGLGERFQAFVDGHSGCPPFRIPDAGS
jgi:hypothetical protein